MRVRWCALALIAACTRPPEQVARQPAAEVADGGPRFFVVAEGGEGTAEYDSFLDLCVVDTSVFICRSGLVAKEGRFVPDPGELSRKRDLGSVPAGHLPDDVWQVGFDPEAPREALNPLAVYRFSRGRWTKAASLGGGYEHRIFDVKLSSWTPGRVLVLDWSWEGEKPTAEFKTFGEGRAPLLPAVGREPSLVQAFPDGSVVVARDDSIEIWTDTAKPSRHVELGGCRVHVWHVASPTDIVTFGTTYGEALRDPMYVCGRRITAAGVETIAGVEHIEGKSPLSYARAPNGDEWLVVGGAWSGSQGWLTSSLWRRTAGDGWRRVELPASLFSRAKDVVLQPLDVFALANDEIWVKAHYREEQGFDQGVILRNKAPAAVCRYVAPEGKGFECRDQ